MCDCKEIPNTPHAWRLSYVKDRGPGWYYRFHVEGENLYHASSCPDRKISWDVPNLSAVSYDTGSARWEDA